MTQAETPDACERRCPECGQPNPVERRSCRRCGLELSHAARDRQLLGRLIGPFRLEAVRRRTATGTAFAAVDQTDGRWVELKVLPLAGTSPAVRARRQRELSLRLVHPHLVRVLSAGEAGDFAYVATDGRPDEHPLAELGRQPARRALEFACQLARALECIHEHGLVHRSLSPERVLVDASCASVRLADLGVAQAIDQQEPSLSAGGGLVGDPCYAAPETADGTCAPVSDLYALGATLAFCLTGKAPFPPGLEERKPFELADAEPFPGLVALLRALTDPRPAQRPQGAETVRRRLQELLGQPAETPIPAPLAPPASMRRSVRCAMFHEQAGGEVFSPADFRNLPTPLAQAAQAAWNARPGLPRRMIAYLLWEGLARLLAAIGNSLLLDAGQALPETLSKLPFRPSFGIWVGLARDSLRACPADDALATAARRLLFDAEGRRQQTLLQFLHNLLELRNKSAHVWPEDEEVDLLSRIVVLARGSELFTTGGLVTIASAASAGPQRVLYQPLQLSGAQGSFRGRPFSAPPGLAPGSVYWQCGPRFLQLDPFWIFEDDTVLQLLRVDPGRPRYGSLDGSPPRVVKQRYAQIGEVLGMAGEPLPAARLNSATPSDDPAGEEEQNGQDAFVGRVLGGVYRVVELIGRGGMGVVYRGWDTRLHREVALKLLVGGVWAAREVRQRFLNEARVLAAQGHPHIVHIFEVGEEAGCLFSVMELLAGPTLEDWIAQQRASSHASPSSIRQRVRWIVAAARALHAVHQLQVVHRDVKPANLMLDAAGQVRVLDFGLAHIAGEELTKTRAQLGTPRYMAPEQMLDAKRVGPACDVYGLGMSLYALLSLEKPFADLQTDHDILKQAQLGNLPRLSTRVPGIAEELETIVAKATQPDDSRRFASAAALADDLERWLDGRPIAARPAGVGERLRKYSQRHPVRAVALLLLASLFIGMGSLTALVVAEQATSERNLADFRRIADLKRIADLLDFVPTPSDTTQWQPWLQSYAGVQGRLAVHRKTRTTLAGQLQSADSLSLASATGIQDAWMLGALEELFDQWALVEAHRLQLLQQQAAVGEQWQAAHSLRLPIHVHTSLDQELRLIPAGDFLMGSPVEEPERSPGESLHTVTLTRSYYLAAHEVDQAAFTRLMGFGPSEHAEPTAPVDSVTWYDALAFCNALSEREDLEPAYELSAVERDSRGQILRARVRFLGLDVEGYRLPTEAEWERACRAGSPGPRYGGLAHIAWSVADTRSGPMPGGQRRPNVWGLFDMIGNVAEWCWDGEREYSSAPALDPLGPEAAELRIRRGGHIFDPQRFCRAAARFGHDPDFARGYLGFRIARTAKPQ